MNLIKNTNSFSIAKQLIKEFVSGIFQSGLIFYATDRILA